MSLRARERHCAGQVAGAHYGPLGPNRQFFVTIKNVRPYHAANLHSYGVHRDPRHVQLAARMKVAVFASGGGSNLQALLDACPPSAPAHVDLVLSNRAESGALAKARAAAIRAHVLTDPRDGSEIVRALEGADVDLVVLAGYLKLIPPSVVAAFRGRMINVHPSLLPAFGGEGMYGKRVHQAVLAVGATVSGATVHLVDEEYDRGRIVAQWPVPVLADDTPDTLAERVLAVEHQLLPAVVLTAARQGRVEALRLTPPDFAFTNAAAANLAEVWRGLASPIE